MPDEPAAPPDDEPTARVDPEHPWTGLSARQRDTLEAVCRLERTGSPPDVAALEDALAQTPGDERVDDVLEALAGRDLLRIQSDPPTDRYQLTYAGWSLLRNRVESLANACGMSVVSHEDGGVAGTDGGGL